MLWCVFALSNAFSTNKPIFISGSTSKLGQNVVEKLTSQGYSVRCFVRDHRRALSLYEDNELVSLVKGDLLDKNSLDIATFDCSMAICLHGTTHVSNIKNFPKITDKAHPYYVNYIGTKNIVDACKKHNIPKIVRTTGLLTAFADVNPFAILFNVVFSNNIYWHKRAEEYIKDSGVNYTIIRPGGIKEKQYNNVKIYEDKTSPPANIDVSNLAKIVTLVSIGYSSHIYENKTIACKGF
jgi:nucleoside-diphosphate-sugar epimerase